MVPVPFAAQWPQIMVRRDLEAKPVIKNAGTTYYLSRKIIGSESRLADTLFLIRRTIASCLIRTRSTLFFSVDYPIG
jgi:hypothetical protein